MTGSELLMQRFVDQELSAEERVQLLVRLGRDEELRQRVVALERLSLGVSQLPRPVVPDGFVAQVLAKTTAPAPSWWSRAAASLWTPHVFEWNLAGAATCVALLAVGGVIAGIGTRSSSTTPSVPPAPVAASAAPSHERVLVRLVVVHPGARTVQAAGDFNGWNPTETPLEQVSNGAWTVTIPLEPGRYEYQFVVDGEQWIADPFAVEQNDDGFGSRNAVLDVRPAGASL
jgi:Glycogen recognition site of AMP-activated protein kinase